ncbi:CGNR zinc finger domain-containing protein [Kitasatospora kifunensis]|uniref:Putative RNA-binding Zn ribbon-like protein n=1 Tax=Kitasatospora kifunensis TaxID=58351 RepID=A0A7W7R7A5_KITKI|nr:CGNR zinc finger domain-containing protein [Kitasatospora kifunensis]MBB4926762.1 putative RNA-binding Zn ribbon-like protein [Kitasatospora kifunensis]
MLITHDTECALGLLVELLNTSPEVAGREQLPDVAALDAFVVRGNISEVDSVTPLDLAAVHRLRGQLRDIFTAPSTQVAAELVNALVAAVNATPRLTDHDGHGWHMHYFAPHAALADHLAAELGMALGLILMAGERERLRRCEAPDCARVFVDLSRNRSRRYCDSRTCGNRMHVAAYRARQRSAADSAAVTDDEVTVSVG